MLNYCKVLVAAGTKQCVHLSKFKPPFCGLWPISPGLLGDNILGIPVSFNVLYYYSSHLFYHAQSTITVSPELRIKPYHPTFLNCYNLVILFLFTTKVFQLFIFSPFKSSPFSLLYMSICS